eukprot:403332949
MKAMLNGEKNSLTKIQPDTWLNIPVCIVKAFKQIIDTFQNQQQILKELNERQNERERMAFGKLRKMEQLIYEKDDSLHRVLDISERTMYDKIRKIQIDVEQNQQLQDQKLREIYNNSYQDREYMQQKLSGVEDSKVIRDYIESQLISMEHRFRKQQFDYQDEIDKAFTVLREENLIIPGLVGEYESFTNLRGWVSYMNTHVQLTINEFEAKFNKKLSKESKRADKEQIETKQSLKDQIQAQISILNEKIQQKNVEIVQQMKQEINEKIMPVKQEQSSIQNLVQFFEKKIEQLKNDIHGDKEEVDQFQTLQDQITTDCNELKDDYIQRLKQLEDDLKSHYQEKEESLKKQIEQLKAEIRISNQEKGKSSSSKVEMTDKIKRQIVEIVQSNIEKYGIGKGGQQQSGVHSNIRTSQNESSGVKFKNSLMVKRDPGNQLIANQSNEGNQSQKKTRNSYFQQQVLEHARAKSTLDNYAENDYQDGIDSTKNTKKLGQLYNNDSVLKNKLLLNSSIKETDSTTTHFKTIRDFNEVKTPTLDPAAQFALHMKNLKLQNQKVHNDLTTQDQQDMLPSLNEDHQDFNSTSMIAQQPHTQQQKRRQNALTMNRTLTPITQVGGIHNNSHSINTLSNNLTHQNQDIHEHLQSRNKLDQNISGSNPHNQKFNNFYSTVQIDLDSNLNAGGRESLTHQQNHKNRMIKSRESNNNYPNNLSQGSDSKSNNNNNRFRNRNSSHSAIRPGRTQSIQNIKISTTGIANNNNNKQIIFSQTQNEHHTQLKNKVLAVKFETFNALE